MQFQNIHFALAVLFLSPMWCSAADPNLQITCQSCSFAVCPGCPTGTGGINDEGLVGAAGPTMDYVL